MAVIGTTFGPYRIVSHLGAGGMGEVYRAHDARLGRDVALKILPPHRSNSPEYVARMVRESRLAAGIEHPGIVTIHDVGEQDGQFYIVSELVDGETLRQRLARGAVTPREVVRIGTAIASALAAAHTRGVVHRDLKPENVMTTTSGAVKVLDFGVAKFIAPPDGETQLAQTDLTEPGAVVGTPAYMSPEQLEGRATDHRGDQFALGVMLYEMLAGKRPFTGRTPAEVSASILRDESPPFDGVAADVPAPLIWVINRCLSKEPEQRYASTTDLVHALNDIGSDAGKSRGAAPATAAPRSKVAGALIGVAIVVLALAAGWTRLRPASPAPAPGNASPRAVAVLPFTTIGDGEQYLADGLSEAINRELGHVRDTRVIASNSAFAYRGKTETLRQIGHELGADLLVRGSVQRSDDRLRISAALIEAATETTLWSNSYTRAATDLLAVQDDIGWQVASRLAKALGAEPPPRPLETPKTSPDAYEAYLRGMTLMRGNSAGFGEGIAELEKAVALDPGFALAHARLASAYTQQFFYNASDAGLERKAFVEIEKALAINSDLAEAYVARAQLIWNVRNGFPHERAIADLRRAIENNPNLLEAYVELGKLYYHTGFIDKAIAASDQALVLDPRSIAGVSRKLSAQVDGGRRDEVAEALSRNPQWTPAMRSDALAFLGRTDEAIAALAPDGLAPGKLKALGMDVVAFLARAVASKGLRDDATRLLAIALPLAANPRGLSDKHHAQFNIGCTYALLGDRDKAVEWLTKAANEGYPSLARFSSEPSLASLKGDEKFDALMARLRADHERWAKTF